MSPGPPQRRSTIRSALISASGPIRLRAISGSAFGCVVPGAILARRSPRPLPGRCRRERLGRSALSAYGGDRFRFGMMARFGQSGGGRDSGTRRGALRPSALVQAVSPDDAAIQPHCWIGHRSRMERTAHSYPVVFDAVHGAAGCARAAHFPCYSLLIPCSAPGSAMANSITICKNYRIMEVLMRMASRKKENSLLIAAEQGIQRRSDARASWRAALARIGAMIERTTRTRGSWLWRYFQIWECWLNGHLHDTLCKPVTIVMVPA